jgi:hypothetical protein
VSLSLAAPEFGPRKLYANLGCAANHDDGSLFAVNWHPADLWQDGCRAMRGHSLIRCFASGELKASTPAAWLHVSVSADVSIRIAALASTHRV